MSDDALVPYAPPAELSPDAAEQRAAVIQAELNLRPDDAVVRAWLEYVAVAIARPRPTDDEIVTLTGVLLDGEYSAAVFTPTTRREAERRFKYWPSAAEVWELLAPRIEEMGIELPGLDRIVRNAKLAPIVPAREAFGYDSGPANPMPWQAGMEWRRGGGLTIRKAQTEAQEDTAAQRQADEVAARSTRPARGHGDRHHLQAAGDGAGCRSGAHRQ